MKYEKIPRYKYKLAEDETYHVGLSQTVKTEYIELQDGEITIYKGYRWDGPSGPTFDTDTFMNAALVHDALYQLMREGHLDQKLRKYVDQLLRQIMLADIEKVYQAMPKNTLLKKGIAALYLRAGRVRAWYVYHAVRLSGAKYVKALKPVIVYEI